MYESFEDLRGKTLKSVIVSGDRDVITFETADGNEYRLYHSQDCCESVYVEEIIGDLDDLLGAPILQAEESSGSNDGSRSDASESYTWTFYKLATIKGSVTIRWLGVSNGHYSESVSFVKVA